MPGLLVALDYPTGDEAVDMARRLRPHVSGYKVGLGLLFGEGRHSVERVVELGLPVFVDAKLHDIPAQVESAAMQLGRRGARWVTAHIPGGAEMLTAAASGLAAGSDGVGGVLGVSLLTSLDEEDLGSLGIAGSAAATVERWVGMAASTPVEGVVCSAGEVSVVRRVSGHLLTVTPGIRSAGAKRDDQKRTATVEMAAQAGADYLVVGRAITGSGDPVEMARSLSDELNSYPVV